MGAWQDLKDFVRGEIKQDEFRKTKIASGGKRFYFSERVRSKQNIEKYKTMYKQDGNVMALVNAIAVNTVYAGYELSGENSVALEHVKEFISNIDFDPLLMDTVIESIVKGDAFWEKVKTRGGDFTNLVLVDAETMERIRSARTGRTLYYQQVVVRDGIPNEIKIAADKIAHFMLIRLGDSDHGLSLVGANYDSIYRKAKADAGIAAYLERHGFPKYHIQIQKPAQMVPKKVVEKIEKEFKDINSKNEFITTEEIEIKALDVTSTQIRDVQNYFITQLTSGFMVPEEVAGLGRGSTEATAKVRILAFERMIMGYQKILASTIESDVFDYLLELKGIDATKMKNKVYINFKSVSPMDELTKAETISTIEKVMPGTFSKKEVRSALGLNAEISEDNKDEEEDEPENEQEPVPDIEEQTREDGD